MTEYQWLTFLNQKSFWEGVKLGADIIQSITISLAAIIGGVWAIKTLGYRDRVGQLETINQATLHFKNAVSGYYSTNQILNLAGGGADSLLATSRDNLIHAQVYLRQSLTSALRIDPVKKLEWESKLNVYLFASPDSFGEKEMYDKVNLECNQILADIFGMAHTSLSKRFSKFIRQIQKF